MAKVNPTKPPVQVGEAVKILLGDHFEYGEVVIADVGKGAVVLFDSGGTGIAYRNELTQGHWVCEWVDDE